MGSLRRATPHLTPSPDGIKRAAPVSVSTTVQLSSQVTHGGSASGVGVPVTVWGM